jgi:TolA-binding protein
MNRPLICRIAAVLLLLVSLLDAQTPAPAPAPAAAGSQQAYSAAVRLYEDGKWPEALAAFQKFAEDFKFSDTVPQAIYYQAWCWFNIKRYQESANVLEKLIRGYPSSPLVPEAMLKQAECYRELRDHAKATAIYRDFQQRFPKHDLAPQAMLGEAWMLYRQDNLAGAKAIAQNVRTQLAADPVAGLDALFLLAQILNEEKNFDAARAIFKQIAGARANPRATEAMFLAGESLFEAKQYKDAIPYYERVQSRSVLLANIDAELEQLRTQAPKIIAAGGSVASIQSRMQSLRQLSEQIKQRPDLHASALIRIANCYQVLGKPEEASVVYRHFLRLFPDDPLAEKAQFGLIQMLSERRMLKEADAEAKLFEQKYPRSTLATDALFLQAESLFNSQQFQDALERYQKFRTAGQNAELVETAEFRIADCFYGLKQFERSRDASDAFLRNHPQSRWLPEMLFRLGRSYFELSQLATEPKAAQQNLTEAVKRYEQIRSQHPGSALLPEVIFQLGYLHGFLGAYDRASFEKSTAAFNEFVTRWPDHRLAGEALYQTARNHSALGQFDKAVAGYKQLVEKFPANDLAPFAAFEIADAYASAKKPAEKLAALRAYVEKYPGHVKVGDALYAVGAELEARGKPDEAIAEYRKLIARASAALPGLSEELRNAAIAAQIRVAGLLEQRGPVTDAVADCRQFLENFKNEPVAARAMVTQIASLYRRAKQFSEAYAALDQLAGQYRANAPIRLATATAVIELALAEKDFSRAEAAARTLLAGAGKDELPAASYLLIGTALLKTDRFTEARDVFEKSLARYPNDERTTPVALVGFGQAQLGAGNPDQAEAAFAKMLASYEQHPARAEAELGLGKVYEAKGKLEEAVKKYDWVMNNARGETGAEAAYRLASMTFARKDYKVALAFYLRVALMTGGPMGEEAALRAAECHQALGNVEGARGGYQSFLRRFPDSSLAEQAKTKLAALPAPKAQP